MSATMEAQLVESDMDTSASREDLRRYLGSSTRPGRKLEVWVLVLLEWKKAGEFEVKDLSASHIQFSATNIIRLDRKIPPFKLEGELVLVPQSNRCRLTLNGVTDDDARYYVEHSSILVESKSFKPYGPSIRFWADGEETKADVWVNVGWIRPKFHIAIAPPKSKMIETWQRELGTSGES